MLQYLIIILIGFFSGLITGATGITATGLLLSALSLTQIIKDYRIVMGTILYVFLFPFTAGSAFEFYQKGFIDFKIGNLLLIGIISGSLLGTRLILTNYKLSITHIKLLTCIISGIVSIVFLREYLIDLSGKNKVETFFTP